jgi:hypothetical protein
VGFFGCGSVVDASEPWHRPRRECSFDVPQFANDESQSDEEKPTDGGDRARCENLAVKRPLADRKARGHKDQTRECRHNTQKQQNYWHTACPPPRSDAGSDKKKYFGGHLTTAQELK